MSRYTSQAFSQWVAELPAETLIAAIVFGLAVWILSLAELVRRELTKGEQ